MADETESTNHQLSVSVAPEGQTTKVSVGNDGKATTPAVTTGDSVKYNTEDTDLEKDLDAVASEDADEEGKPEAGTDGTAEKEPTDTEDGLAERSDLETDLPEYDPANEEVRASYDAKYLKDNGDGKVLLNLDAFNAEAQAHLDNGKLDINKGSREYIKDLMGIDDAGIDTYLEGLANKAAKQFQAIEAVAGGSEAYDTMIGWARADGGYTEAQRDAFNAALRKGGEDAETAVALLKSRFERAGGKLPAAKQKAADTKATPEKAQPGLRGKRPSSPARKVTASPSGSKVEGFKDSEEHRLAMVDAGQDPAKVAAVRQRLRASKWFSGNK